MRRSFRRLCVAGAVLILLTGVLTADVSAVESPPGVAWTRQFGTSQQDDAKGVAVSSSGVYVVGYTDGVFPGQTSAGWDDAYLSKYSTEGDVLWTRQFGTTGQDHSRGVAVNGSGVYVTGVTYLGSFPGFDNAGWDDVFLRKYDSDGNHLWTRQFGTSESEWGSGVAVDGSGVYVTGVTVGSLPGHTNAGNMDGFVRKYDTAGSEVWTRQFGTSTQDHVASIAVDASGVYVVGDTGVPFPGETIVGGWDGFVRRFDTAGNHHWTRQFGTSEHDAGSGVTVNATGVYVTGVTPGSFPGFANAGNEDGFVRKYDTAGNEVWTRQFGTSGVDYPHAVTVDASMVYVTGSTDGVFPRETGAGGSDAFVRAYNATGDEVWTDQFGTSEWVGGKSVAADASGLYVAGQASGVFPGQVDAGLADGFVRRYRDGSPLCMGRAATIQGTAAGETLQGTPGDDVIDARGGDDVVYGYGGDDVICGGGGDDTLYGGPGADRLVDTRGVNVFHGGGGDDEIRAGGASSEVYAEAGDDIVRTWALVGYVDGGVGNDTLSGSYRPEIFIGGDGHDTIRPHNGLNEVYAGPGNDDIWAQGAGRDQIIDGGPGNDLIRADQGNDTLMGGDGDDIIYGRKGNDTIDGGDGNDELWGHQGNDTIRGGDGNDVIKGWGGKDTLWGDGGNDTLFGGDHADVVVGGDGVDRLVGGSGDDELNGGIGADLLNGRDGDDVLTGGDGDDLLKGGPGNDGLWGESGNDDMRGAKGIDGLWGGSGNDHLRGHAGADTLHGQDGHDLLHGGTGTDLLDGGDGTDTLDGGADIDECTNGETYIRCEGVVTDPAPEVVVIEDGFEGYAPGTYPSAGGWYVEWSGHEAFVSDEYSHTGTKSFRLSGYGGWVRTDALLLDLNRADRLSYEVAVHCVSQDVNCAEVGFFVRTEPNESWPFNAFLFTEDHKILVKGTGWRIGGPPTEYVDTGLQWTHDRWYQIRAEIDYKAETMSAWIDGNLVAEGLVPAPPDATEIFELSTHYGLKDGIVYYDDVRIEITTHAAE